MGRFTYDGGARVDVEDRALAHLQAVMGAKLRRGEAFFFAWKDEVSLGSGRTAVWIHAHAHLVFTFSGSRSPAINRSWLEALMHTANSPTGLYLVPEPPQGAAEDIRG
ncbi:ATP-dependent DNA ligase [Microbacterium sp. NPDC089189]|uniref:DUF7882 family protein n=1 Tax=Microbacterium sp. NPDC089189 TaxID=3154972 RepID=UPI00341E9D8D